MREKVGELLAMFGKLNRHDQEEAFTAIAGYLGKQKLPTSQHDGAGKQETSITPTDARQFGVSLVESLRNEDDPERQLDLLMAFLNARAYKARNERREIRYQRDCLAQLVIDQQKVIDDAANLLPIGKVVSDDPQMADATVVGFSVTFRDVFGNFDSYSWEGLHLTPLQQAVEEVVPQFILAAVGAPSPGDLADEREIPGVERDAWLSILGALFRCKRLTPEDYNGLCKTIFEHYWPAILKALHDTPEENLFPDSPNGIKDAHRTMWDRFRKKVDAALCKAERRADSGRAVYGALPPRN